MNCMAATQVGLLCVERAVAAQGQVRRLFHGRGRLHAGFEHVTVDSFPPLMLVTLFRPLEPAGEAALVAELRSALGRTGHDCLAIQRRYLPDAPVESVAGALAPSLVVEEDGLHYQVETGRGQNLGFFPDMRLARQWLRERAAGRRVLNLFAFTCAFSVVARAAGAERVVNIDLSRASLAMGQRNHHLNSLDVRDIHFLDHDVFRSWNKLHRLGRYDIVIMDPPTLQKGSFSVERDYAKVVRRFSKLLQPDGDVLACLNAPHLGEAFLDDVMQAELPGAERAGRLPNPPEFADADEQASLKVIHYRYRRPAHLPPLEVASAAAADDD